MTRLQGETFTEFIMAWLRIYGKDEPPWETDFFKKLAALDKR